MTERIWERGLWATALVSLAAATFGWRDAEPDAAGGPPLPALPAVAVPRAIPTRVLEDAADSVYENDPFRLERRPPTVAYSPADERAPPAPVEPVAPKPALVLKGTVGGPPWAAVLEGVPGREGSVVVQQGDTLGGLRVHAVGRNTVTISGADTTWRLNVRHSWQ